MGFYFEMEVPIVSFLPFISHPGDRPPSRPLPTSIIQQAYTPPPFPSSTRPPLGETHLSPETLIEMIGLLNKRKGEE